MVVGEPAVVGSGDALMLVITGYDWDTVLIRAAPVSPPAPSAMVTEATALAPLVSVTVMMGVSEKTSHNGDQFTADRSALHRTRKS